MLYFRISIISISFVAILAHADASDNVHHVGIAAIEVTPKYAIRLNGFGFRRSESEGVYQRLWVKALAIGKERPTVVLTVDNLGIPSELVAELAGRLAKHGVSAERLAITATHTHTAPMLQGANQTLFGVPIPKEHLERIAKYTREFVDAMEKATVAALKDRKPARLHWGIGSVGFASNRRTAGGPVDHDLPILTVRSLDHRLRAIWFNYACHAVTLSHNKIGGDWPGYAQQAIEDDHPGAIALCSIGCGADSNPSSGVTGDKIEIAQRQGAEIAREVRRLLKGYLAPVSGPIEIATKTIELPLAPLPTREEWQKRANRKDAVGHHARVNLDRLDRGEKLPTKLTYSITSWSFGDSLGMLFLPGEVVVDYALTLKKELDGRRLWINAYANDDPGYIPSERVLKEGGYEGGDAMIYYDVPAPFRPGLEQRILDTVRSQLSNRFAVPFDARRTQSLPRSPQQSLALHRVSEGLTVQLVAAEPLVRSPVAIDFGPDGRLWVAEMFDYPQGANGDKQPGGRVSVLEDVDGDGLFDRSTIFLDRIPFPTGVTVWRDGVLICAAPDILFARDTNGDGRADEVTKLFTGFGKDNYQARVNSLCYGLDHWVHGSCGLFGGTITNRHGQRVELGDRDFRLRPDQGLLEPATGRTQQGRMRDDWGNWFGCENSTFAMHYVLPDHYLKRNPHLTYPNPTALVAVEPEAARVYPARSLQLFKLSGPPGIATAACGLSIYRDDLLGREFTGNLFVCEPVNLVVHRLKLAAKGSTFTGLRAPEERDREFLASTDPWFRPVQTRTGPEGALWIVDMYRHVIEHPHWIPPEELANLDVRAGATMGRIYRVVPTDKPLPKVPRLERLSSKELVEALDTANGTRRDLAGQMLLWRGDTSVVPALVRLATGPRPETRLQALCILDGLGKLPPSLLNRALLDCEPGVRRHAVRLAEAHLEELGPALVERTEDDDAQVRLQLAFTLGHWRDPRAAAALAKLAIQHGADPFLQAAVLSSIHSSNLVDVLTEVRKVKSPPRGLIRQLFALVASLGDAKTLEQAIELLSPTEEGFASLGMILDALERRKATPPKVIDDLLAQARRIVADGSSPGSLRRAAVSVLGRDRADLNLLADLLVPRNSHELQAAAVTALARSSELAVAERFLAGWKTHTPPLRNQILDLLLGRPAWRERLLMALEKGEVATNQLDAARRQRLLASKDEATRRRAEKLFASTGSSDRQRIVKEYASVVTMLGDVERGKVVFIKHCSACHRLNQLGHEVGPDLAALANKTPLYLLGEILDPNRNLDSRYLQYLATTTHGLSYTGLLASETATSLTLRMQEGKTQQLLRSELEQLESSGKSLMPEGFEKDISKAEMGDLLAFLTRQSNPPKEFAGNRPTLLRATEQGVVLAATTCEIHGNQICFEQPYRNIGFWHGESDHIVWTVQVDKPATFDVWLDASCDDPSAGNVFVLDGGEQQLRGKMLGTGGWQFYQQRKLGSVTLPRGQVRLTLRPEGLVRGALMDLRTLCLVPPGVQPNFAQARSDAPNDPAVIARQILDETLPEARRVALVNEHPKLSESLLVEMTKDLKPGKEEYRRIPWIWRVSIAAGKRNDADELKRLLAIALPKLDEPLRDWQAVVLGGGLINGISLIGQWPDERFTALLREDESLRKRWQRALTQAATMADDERVPTGTRYDALRMIALDAWERSGDHLAKYLAKGIHEELMQGAISGLSDARSPKVAALLLGGLGHYSASNRKLAVEALLRTPERITALLDAIEAKRVDQSILSAEQVKTLRSAKDAALRARVEKLLGK